MNWNFLICIFIIFIFIQCYSAHICILHPHQRGDLSIGQPGDPSCFRRTPYCGDIEVEKPSSTFVAGSTFDFHFQQNLNHWTYYKPGFFDIAITYTVPPSEWSLLAKFSDWPGNEMVWQTNFSIPITLPKSKTSDHAILRLRYVSFNPDEVYPANNTDAIFYNCADIAVVPSATPNLEKVNHEKVNHEKVNLEKVNLEKVNHEKVNHEKRNVGANFNCATVPQWSAKGRSYSTTGMVHHNVMYDAVNQFVRWDRSGQIEGSKFGRLNTITNYTSDHHTSVEWVWYPDEQICYAYGPDRFYPWSFGTNNSMVFDSTTRLASGELVNQWVLPNLPGNDWRFSNFAKGCLPQSIYHQQFSMTFFDHQVGPIQQDLFVPPSYCDKAEWISCKGPDSDPRRK